MSTFAHDAIPDESAPAPECSDLGVFVVLVLAGLLPFLGMILTGAWSERELAMGAVMLMLAIAGLLSRIRPRRNNVTRG